MLKLLLTPSEEELLIAIGETMNYSLGGRYSKQEILKRLSGTTKNNPKRMKRIEKAFTKLRTKQLIQKHPSGEMTYELGRLGLDYLITLKNASDTI